MISNFVKDGYPIDLPAVLNMSSDAFIIIDRDRKLVFHYLKDGASNLFVTPPMQVGQSLMQMVNPGVANLVAWIIDQITISRLPYQSEVEYNDDGGRMVYLSMRYLPVFIPDKEFFFIYILIRDISPQKIFEKRLITEAKNIGTLVEKANAMVIGLDARGYITDWNEHCSRVTGYTKNEVYAQKISLLLLPDDQKDLFRELPEKIMQNHLITNQEIIIRRKDGQRLTILLNGTPRANASGEIVGTILVGQDVTELMKYRQSLEDTVQERTGELLRALKKEREVVEMKNRFVAIASHEFRTPLSTIQAAAHFIRQSKMGVNNREVNSRLDTIDKQVQHMTSLLDDVLLYGKSDAGKIQLFFTEIKLSEFLNKTVAEVEQAARHTHCVEKDFQTLPDGITSDEKLLRSILTNLLSNAIKFSPGKKRVYLNAGYDRNCLTLSVRDEGMGISPHDRSRIFETFLRGYAATPIEGTGLGLSIVKKAIELLNGHIAVESTLDKGSLFVIKIPDQVK